MGDAPDLLSPSPLMSARLQKLTRKQREALALVARFDRDEAACLTHLETWGDSYGAFINWRTAEALERRELVTIDRQAPDGGVVCLSPAGRTYLRGQEGDADG